MHELFVISSSHLARKVTVSMNVPYAYFYSYTIDYYEIIVCKR